MSYSIIFIALGGAAGALLRFFTANWVHSLMSKPFPWGTLSVNVLGSFLMGLLYFSLSERFHLSEDLKKGILVGGLGAFTTFSTFSMDNLLLIQKGSPVSALINMVVSLVCCMLAVYLGHWISRLIL